MDMEILSVEKITPSCCGGRRRAETVPPRLDQPFVLDQVETPLGKVPRVASMLRWTDRIGSYKARWGIGRMRFTIDPGLYALGEADGDSPVFVTANYKMSFDLLREALTGLDAWVLVLDTKGINVWCAAGKGTFGTDELVSRVAASGLARLVSHRELVLPQLAAPGVAAHEVKERTGFRVVYGPVRAADIPAFLRAGLKATRPMRTKAFTMPERLGLVPMETVPAVKAALPAAAALFVLSFLLSGFSVGRALGSASLALVAFGASILAGAVLTPLLLPWLPGRAFSAKGLCLGILAAALIVSLRGSAYHLTMLGTFALVVSIPAMAAYLAMNFTGASTFTSLSGVRKEMRWALPLEVAGTSAGFALWIAAVLVGR